MSSSVLLLQNGTVLCHDEHDHVSALMDTDLLIRGNIIAAIDRKIEPPENCVVIDCSGKIISPGFIDTHHHLWQTQLKGRHADEAFIDYFPSGFFQAYNFTPDDVFWGQLGGALEAIDAGTTFVLDHMHQNYSTEHADSGLRATEAAGIRSVYAYAVPLRLAKWTKEEIEPEKDMMPDWASDQIDTWAQQQPFGDGRVHIGLGFDAWFLPREIVIAYIERFRKAGVKVITSHVGQNAVQGYNSIPNLLKDYGLLKSDIVLSHAIGFDADEYKILSDAGIYISSTPDTECQMGMGWPVAFKPGVNGSFGIDCHTNNTSSILSQARAALQMARQETNQPLVQQKKTPNSLRGSTQQAFNLATIEGARAVGMADKIGSIAVGKLADLVIFDATSPSMACAVDYDPLVAVLRHSDIRDIDTVIIDGKVRKQNGKLVPVDVPGQGLLTWSDIFEKLRESQQKLTERIGNVSIPRARQLLTDMWHVDTSKLEDVQ